jgi:hypothetical protein
MKSATRRLSYTKTAVVALAALGTAALTYVAMPASAGTAQTFSFGGDEAQVDNDPGDGAGSWYWFHNASRDGQRVQLQIKYIDEGGQHSAMLFSVDTPGDGESGSGTLPGDAVVARLCKMTDQGYGDCGNWEDVSAYEGLPG